MPSGPFAHVCLMVKDLDQAVADWTKILRALDPQSLEEPLVRYEDFEGGDDRMRWAAFVSHHGAEIQLMEPAADSPLGRRLAKHGEGVHHICFTTDDPAAVARRLAAEGVGLVGHADVQRFAIEVGVDGNRADAHLAAGPYDTDGDFAAVGDQDLLQHKEPFD